MCVRCPTAKQLGRGPLSIAGLSELNTVEHTPNANQGIHTFRLTQIIPYCMTSMILA